MIPSKRRRHARAGKLALALILSAGLSGGSACTETPEPGVRSQEDEFAQTRGFISKQASYYMSDPVIGHVHRPNLRLQTVREEHPKTRIAANTNNLGFRNDRDTAQPKPEGMARILVAGDSHTDGLVWNDESFAHLIELELTAALPGASVEVLNAGVGHYGPYHYGRLMKRYGLLGPDFVIVNFFAGNDFMDAARLLEATTKLVAERPDGYHEALARAREKMPGATSQGLNQIYYFAHASEMIAPVMRNAVSELVALKRDCDERGVGLVVLIQPTKLDVEGEAESGDLDAVRELLDLGPGELALNRELSGELAGRLAEAGIEVHDLLQPMRESGDSLFWEVDHHLSVSGHRLLADSIMARYGSELRTLVSDPG